MDKKEGKHAQARKKWLAPGQSPLKTSTNDVHDWLESPAITLSEALKDIISYPKHEGSSLSYSNTNLQYDKMLSKTVPLLGTSKVC